MVDREILAAAINHQSIHQPSDHPSTRSINLINSFHQPSTSIPMKPKLLIVDDDEEIRTQMKWALSARTTTSYWLGIA